MKKHFFLGIFICLGFIVFSQEYRSVIIGNQIWMSENLNSQFFNNGDLIPEARSIKEWNLASQNREPAWCHYKNDPAYEKKYGKLYNYFAINSKKDIAPKGWHVPTQQEWVNLAEFIKYEGGSKSSLASSAGWRIKEGGYNGNGINSYGFSALPSGSRYDTRWEGYNETAIKINRELWPDGFHGEGDIGHLWSRTEKDDNSAFFFGIYSNYDSLYSSKAINKGTGYSVRLIKDVENIQSIPSTFLSTNESGTTNRTTNTEAPNASTEINNPEINKNEFAKLLLNFENTNSTNSKFSGNIRSYPTNPSESYYKKDYYNNQIIYDGYIKEIINSSNGNTVYKQQFKHGRGKEYFINSTGYQEGFFVNGKLNDYGEHISNAYGFSYKGYFENGVRSGEGILVMDGLNGTTKYIYEGSFLKGKYNGKGTLTYKSMSYSGDFVNDLMSGKGVNLYSNGDKYVGSFVNGRLEGYGEYYWANGDFYKGGFFNNTRNGNGELTFANGTKQKGIFENGNHIGEKKIEVNQEIAGSTQKSLINANNYSNPSNDFVRVGQIDIMTKDLGEFNFYQAKEAIQKLGGGWRLPTESELTIMFKNQDKIGSLTRKASSRNREEIYWGSYLGGTFDSYFSVLNNNVNPGLTHSRSWSSNSQQNEFYLVRVVRNMSSREKLQSIASSYNSLVNIAKQQGIDINSASNEVYSKKSSTTSNISKTCTKCSKESRIMDYDEYSRTFTNERKETKYGFIPCNVCQGTKKMSVTAGSDYRGKGCTSCKNSGWMKCNMTPH